jgi:beta-lactam-binding protein with PASTA domain
MLAGNGLATGSVASQASLSPVGTVLGQSPGAGTIVTFGTPVSLIVSAGGVQVPNVLSYPKNDAISILQGAGLSVSTSSQKACIDPNGVLTESPSGGSVVLPGSTVHLTIDSGTIKSCGVIK